MLRNWLKKLRLKSVQAGDGQRSVDNIDAQASMAQTKSTPVSGPALFPPNYVKDDDDGRPRH